MAQNIMDYTLDPDHPMSVENRCLLEDTINNVYRARELVLGSTGSSKPKEENSVSFFAFVLHYFHSNQMIVLLFVCSLQSFFLRFPFRAFLQNSGIESFLCNKSKENWSTFLAKWSE